MQRCPECDRSLSSDDINIKEGVALCPDCGTLSRLSELVSSDRPVREVLGETPPGCSVNSTGRGVIVKISLRSMVGFVMTAGFALFWNGIVSVFVVIALAGLYTNLVGPIPDWFPAPEMAEAEPDVIGDSLGLGETLFLCLFLTPFVLVGMVMVGAVLMNLTGKIEVVIDELDSYVATGVGFVKWKRRFDPRQVRSVDFCESSWQSNSSNVKMIELSADRTIKFGSFLTSVRMEWLRAVLKELLLRSGGKPSSPSLPYLSWLAR